MLGAWSSGATPFLLVVSGVTLVVAGLPLLFVPLRWARWLRWTVPEHTHLAIYFGRCLGAFACVLAGAGFYVALTPVLQPAYFALMAGSFGLMVLVHAWGALKRIQPLTETVEIGLWVVLLVLTLLCWPA